MDALIRVQVDLMNQIVKGQINYKKTPNARKTVAYIESRLETLEKLWETFNDNHSTLVARYSTEELNTSAYIKDNVQDVTEEAYFEYKSMLREALAKLKQSSGGNGNGKGNDLNHVKLPKISIPTFSGKYTEWTGFKDLFVSLIHNNAGLDKVQKLHYLKGYLSGEAEQLLRHIPITEKNYDDCWTKLINRYDNKRYLSNNILNRFMSQKTLQTESSAALKELLDTMNECLSALTNIGVDTSKWDIIVIYIMSQKLDPESRKEWEAKAVDEEDLPNLELFSEFLEHKYKSLEFLSTKNKPKGNTPVTKQNAFHTVESSNSDTTANSAASTSCPFCKANHKIINCKQFAKEEYDARHNFIQTNKLCFNCLGANHSVFSCRQSTRCRICKRKHHSLLHNPKASNTGNSETETKENVKKNTNPEQEPPIVNTCFLNTSSQVLLATALVNVQAKTGNELTLRCLIDQGSQASFITEDAVQAIGLKKYPHNIYVSGVGSDEGETLASRSIVTVKLISIHDPSSVVTVKAHVLTKLTNYLPSKQVISQPWPELTNLKLADPKFEIPDKIDLLLGAEVHSQILKDGLIKSSSGTLLAQNTKLGWILSGRVKAQSSSESEIVHSNIVISMVAQCRENEQLRKFWEIESENYSSTKILTSEEQECEDYFKETTTRDDSGRYVVSLKLRADKPKCIDGNLKEISRRSLISLERRLDKNPDLKARYGEVIQEYLDLGHMELVPDKLRERSDVVYLPHHAVVREDKTTTKVRVVFNASCPGVNGISLNNELMVGPTLQADLRHIVMRWRQHPICLTADIIKMYRQIKVTEKDADRYQRILWRDGNGVIQHYRLLRVTFGTASAPYLAVRALQQLAHDEGADLKHAADRVLQDFYMDDLMSGCQSVQEGLKVYEEINELMRRGGFELQKWRSNSEELLEGMGKGQSSKRETDMEIGGEKGKEIIEKVLGLTWNNEVDQFQYTVRMPPLTTPITKRKVISDISRLFDPLGWIAPIIVSAKIFIQKLWISGIDWDQKLPPDLLNEWIKYRDDLSLLTDFSIPRWIHQTNTDACVELQGFSDASNDAYAAVVYARVVDSQGEVHVNLITAKTKVSPIKQISIPRLELCGAQLLAKLLLEVSEVMNVPKENIHAWTDSSVVLAWLSSHPSRWKTFIANRVSDILSVLDRSQWSHVRSKDNPADIASRGIKATDTTSLNLWREGPAWLAEKNISYSPQPKEGSQDTDLEERAKKITCAVTQDVEENEMIKKFSSLRKLVRVIAYCRRFRQLTRSQTKPDLPKWLTYAELQEATEIVVRDTQKVHFKEEIEQIKKTGAVSRKNKLASLNPFLKDGILRVGGRLQNAEMDENMKHPILLPHKSHLTDLIIRESHEKTLHGGPQLMLNYIRSKYWIIDAKNLVKQHARKCVVCIRYTSRTTHPIMGQLPAARVKASRPFLQSGVDYAGPIAVRATKGRGNRSTKGYICLFVCMATKAIHLEAVSDMTTEGFLAAFKRFVARRGHCAELWSDNGSNFVGAERELKNLLMNERSSVAVEIADCLASNGTTWHKIPPYSPNFGGLWEAGIKSTKQHLKRVIGSATLTFEETTTVLAQIEACLNSRPLTKLSEDAKDPFPLTPGHFLVGEPLVLPPDTNFEKSNIGSLRRWQFTQRIVQDFWRRWSQEYLVQFLQRYRWNRQVPEPNIGDVVLVKEDGLPPAKWLYGIIVDKHSGADQVTRVVSLRCKGTIIKRPVSKLCILPVTD